MSSTLSPAQIKEAITIASEDLITQLKADSWSVQSLTRENSYTVKVADSVHAYDLWCTCSAWKFKRGAKDCKHCEAVRRSVKPSLNKRKVTITPPKRPKRSKGITKSMAKTEKWFKTLTFSEIETLSTVINEDLYEEWSENEHHIQWKIHEYYEKNEKKSGKTKIQKPKNVKVTCWHCGNNNQKILSMTEAFECDKCKEELWIGDGGFVEVGGIYR